MRTGELKAQRVLRNKTQRDCAEAIGCGINTYNQKENGVKSFTVDEVIKLCDYLEITSDSQKVSIFL